MRSEMWCYPKLGASCWANGLGWTKSELKCNWKKQCPSAIKAASSFAGSTVV